MAAQKLNNTAKAYMEQGDYDSAIERLESSVELDSNVYETYYNLGVAYISAKKFDKAIDALNRALKLNSKYANTYYTLAVAQENQADSIINTDEPVVREITDEKQITDTYKNLTNEQKEQMIEAYLLSIANYRKYVDMINSDKQAEEVNSHITEMENILTKLGYKGSVE